MSIKELWILLRTKGVALSERLVIRNAHDLMTLSHFWETVKSLRIPLKKVTKTTRIDVQKYLPGLSEINNFDF